MPSDRLQGHPRDTGTIATLKRTWTEIQEDNVTDWAAALTYYGVLAMFPALIALVSIVGLVFDPERVTQTLTDMVAELGPASAVDTFRGPIEEVTANRAQSGILLVTGLLGALWAASGYVGAFSRAANTFYEADEARPVYTLRPLQMLVTLVMVLLLALGALAVIVTGPLASAVGGAIGLGDTAVTVWDIAKWPALLLVVTFMLSVLYFTAPNAKTGGFRFITPGGGVAVGIWLIASALFALYVANFSSYDQTYGSLGAIIAFLVWLWITNLAVLIGCQLNAERLRDEQLKERVPGAERRLRLPERKPAEPADRPTSA